MKSWKTSVCGALAIVGPLIAQFFPELSRYGLFCGAVGAGLGLMFARDNNVTSEAAGAASTVVPIKQPDDPRQTRLPISSLLMVFAVLVFVGCSTSRFTKTAPDGSKISAWNSRLIWSTEGFEAIYNTNGVTVKLQKSNTDAQTAGAVAEGVARGLTKAVAP